MNYVLVKFSGNWADEMDIEGFTTFSKDVWDDFYSLVSEYAHSFDVCVGTNEDITFKNGKSFLNKCEVVELDDAEYATLTKLFNGSFGHYNIFTSVKFLVSPDDACDYEPDEDIDDE